MNDIHYFWILSKYGHKWSLSSIWQIGRECELIGRMKWIFHRIRPALCKMKDRWSGENESIQRNTTIIPKRKKYCTCVVIWGGLVKYFSSDDNDFWILPPLFMTESISLKWGHLVKSVALFEEWRYCSIRC